MSSVNTHTHPHTCCIVSKQLDQTEVAVFNVQAPQRRGFPRQQGQAVLSPLQRVVAQGEPTQCTQGALPLPLKNHCRR